MIFGNLSGKGSVGRLEGSCSFSDAAVLFDRLLDDHKFIVLYDTL